MSYGQPRHEVAVNAERFKTNTNPGSGIVLGRNAIGNRYMQVVWLMGNSEEARRKKLVLANETVRKTVRHLVRTVILAEDGTEFSRYNTMRRIHTGHARQDLVTTSDQTDRLAADLLHQDSRGHYAGFNYQIKPMQPEDDAPHFTPRVTGVVSMDRNGFNYGLAALHKDPSEEEGVIMSLRKTPLIHPLAGISPGIGLMVHAYDGPGDPLPSFSSLPITMPLAETPQETAEMYWDMLNPDLRVAIAVKSIDRGPDSKTDYHIINAIEK